MSNTKNTNTSAKNTSSIVKSQPFEVAGQKIDFADFERGEDLNHEYFSFEDKMAEGQTMKIVTTGFTTIDVERTEKNPDGILPAVTFKADDNKFYICGAKMLVESLKQRPLYTPFEVAYLGKAKGKSGFRYDDIRVYELIRK